jgi:hypothetical protein
MGTGAAALKTPALCKRNWQPSKVLLCVSTHTAYSQKTFRVGWLLPTPFWKVSDSENDDVAKSQ